MEPIRTYTEDIKTLISEAKLQEALQKAQALLKGSEQYQALILRTAQYQELTKSIIKGTIDYSTQQREKARIGEALLFMLTELENGSKYNPSLKEEVEAFLASQKAATSTTTTITGNQNIVVHDNKDTEINISFGKKEEEV